MLLILSGTTWISWWTLRWTRVSEVPFLLRRPAVFLAWVSNQGTASRSGEAGTPSPLPSIGETHLKKNTERKHFNLSYKNSILLWPLLPHSLVYVWKVSFVEIVPQKMFATYMENDMALGVRTYWRTQSLLKKRRTLRSDCSGKGK